MHNRWRKSYKFVLLGCGKNGHSYATAIHNNPKMELAAVIDVNPEAASAFGASFHCKAYMSLNEYLESKSQADCAVICTPPSYHTDAACRLMQKGISVLCEQPFALDSASAEKMVDISRAYGVQLQMATRMRFIADIVHTKGLIHAGILGQILAFEGDFRECVNMRNRWNIQPEISGGGVLMSSGSLAVDIACCLFGNILRVRAEEGVRIQSSAVEDTVRLELLTASGIMGTVHLSWNLNNSGEDFFRIYGTQGNLCIGWNKSMYRPNGAKDWIHFGEGYSTMKALSRQLADFVYVVAGEGIPEISAGEEIELVRIMEAAYKSLSTGQYLDVHPSVSSSAAVIGNRRFSVLRSNNMPSSA
jgi:predicted dehydrogenase